MIATHKINGQDIYAQFGWLVTKGVETFLAPNVPKDRFSKDWGDENGIEYDLTGQVYLKPRVFNLTGYLLGDSVQDLLNKFNALTAVLNSTGFLTIYIKSIDSTFTAICKSFPTWETATKIRNQDGLIGFRISVDFDEIVNVALPSYDLYYGGVSAIPTTEQQVLLLPVSSAYQSSFSINTGLNRVVAIAVQDGKSIQSAFDETSNETLTGSFTLRSTIQVNGKGYKIYALQNLISFSSNHIINIVLNG